MSKRLFIIIIIVLIVLLLGLGVVLFFARDNGDESQDPVPEDPVAVVDDPIDLRLPQNLVSEQVVSPILSFSGDSVWYFDVDGRLWQQDIFGGERTEFFLFTEGVSVGVENLDKVWWQPDGSDFIVRQNVIGEISYQIYQASEQRLVGYPPPLTKPIFTTDGAQIVYDWERGDGSHELKISDTSSENFRTITDLFRGDYQFAANSAKSEIAMFVDNQIDPSKIFLVNLDSGEFTDVGDEAAYEGVKFSPDGTKLLAASRDEVGGFANLVMFDLVTGQSLSLGIEGEIAQSVWGADSQRVFVATRFGVMEYDTRDNFFDIVFDFDEGQFAPSTALLHPDGQTLLFVDSASDFLYRVDL